MNSTVQIGDIADIHQGTIDPRKFGNTLFELYSIPGFDDDQTPEQLLGSKIGSNKTILPKHGVLFSKLNPRINRVWTFREAGDAHRIASTEFVCLVPDERRLDQGYLGWRLRAPNIVDELPTKTAAATKSRERIQPRSLLTLPIYLPPLDEQRRIVGILNRAVKIERLRKQAQERLREFMPALFVRMFGDPATNPMRWPRQKLGEVCVETEHRDPTKNPVEEFRYVDISRVDSVRKEINAARLILGAEAPSRARKDIRVGDVLVSSVRPNLNAAAIVTDQLDGGIASTGFCVLRANRKCLTPLYLFLYVISTHFIGTMVSKARGANYPAVSEKDIRNIQIPLPPLHMQSRFSKIAVSAQGVVASAELGSQATESLSHSLMSDFLEKST